MAETFEITYHNATFTYTREGRQFLISHSLVKHSSVCDRMVLRHSLNPLANLSKELIPCDQLSLLESVGNTRTQPLSFYQVPMERYKMGPAAVGSLGLTYATMKRIKSTATRKISGPQR